MNVHKAAFLYAMRIEDNPNFKVEVDAYETAFRTAVETILRLEQGEVINGVLVGMIEPSKVRQLLITDE